MKSFSSHLDNTIFILFSVLYLSHPTMLIIPVMEKSNQITVAVNFFAAVAPLANSTHPPISFLPFSQEQASTR